MPRYFFDVHANGKLTRDHIGTELEGRDDVRREAMIAVPAIANDEIPQDGDRQAYTVFVRDSLGIAVYSATLTYAGLWLDGTGASGSRLK